ncbi:4'-phosphopantetheinyl transferase [Faunimonas pinastri]|uniref:4'-phosphopantetheinyl transferase n=1 Tax=Faunimonas pinastri TaxID=1855383 RepID=A0A1H9PGX2_9HYPH|nr:4'-phosphopantetheinyl transferase superfamily protein [Faunimonas pinastri]SER47404.1 4'-phosphopantetheinyl transferase [Faunimonas pinastri]
MTRSRPEILVLAFPLDPGPAETGRLTALLSPEESARAGKFRHSDDSRRFRVRRGRAREALGLLTDSDPGRLAFEVDAFGKPRLRDSNWRFSLSSSRELGLIALAESAEVGCDVEWRDPSFPFGDVAERFFSASERADLQAVGRAWRREGFFNGWTRKEAFAKARGLGFSLPFQNFDVSLRPDAPARLGAGCDGWTLLAFEPAPLYHAAVVGPAGAVFRVLEGLSGLRQRIRRATGLPLISTTTSSVRA